ncbi:Cyclic nucleotide phosphodiesterase [Trinorchestia longiramus]|nr:Cyclic nucleotide phosphodiesterase [Trinorchestia longiramus]
MGQIFSCCQDQCQKLKRRKLSRDSNDVKSVSSQSSSINDKIDHRVILIEEQDDPNEIFHNKPPRSSYRHYEIVPQKLPELSIQVHPSASFNAGPSASLPAPEDLANPSRSAKVRSRSPSPPRKLSAKKSKLEDYLNFPIFEDKPTMEYIPKAKVAIIVRGLAGSGKSHLTQKLIENFGNNAVECSADLYFIQSDGSYAFDPTRLKDAHNFCFESAKHEMSVVRRSLVIINNTNIKLWEYKRYLYLAKDHNYITLIMEPRTPWAWNPKLLAQKNIHGVDEELISKKLSSYEKSEPIYYAWFLNSRDSCELLWRVFSCLKQVVDDGRCRHSLAKGCLATAPHFLQGERASPLQELRGVAIIVRGLAGSGKSHLTQKLIENFGNNAVECSADLYFVQSDGSYAFDPTRLKDAHNFCFESAKHEMSVVRRSLVIINNTNIKLWEYKRYLYLAKDHNYITLIMEPKTPWAWNPKLLAQKNIHGVDEELISKKLSSYEKSEPIYYAWFLNSRDSCELLWRVFSCLKQVVDDGRCRHSLAKGCLATAPHFLQGGGGPPRTYYSQCGRGGAFQNLHCTAMYSNKGKRPGAQEYSQRPDVQQNMGKVDTLKVTDIMITPRTVGARVELSPEQLRLWGQSDESEMPSAGASLYASPPRDDDVAAPDVEQMEGMLLEQVNSDLVVCEPDGSLATLRINAKDRVQGLAGGGSGPGGRAHITVVVGPGVSPVVTGFDLLRVLMVRDQNLSGDDQTSCGEPRTTKLECGTLTQYEEGVFVVHLNESVEMSALFAAYY